MKYKLKNRQINAAGFTLVEVIVVIAVIGILSAIAIPNFLKWVPGIRLKGAARDLYGNMQATKMVAVKTNKNTAITFDPANQRYLICNNWDTGTTACTVPQQIVDLGSLPNGIGFGHGNATKQANSAGSAFTALSPDDSVSYTSPTNIVVFNPQGGCNNAGYVYLDHETATTTYVVGSLITGAIKLKRWNGSIWQ